MQHGVVRRARDHNHSPPVRLQSVRCARPRARGTFFFLFPSSISGIPPPRDDQASASETRWGEMGKSVFRMVAKMHFASADKGMGMFLAGAVLDQVTTDVCFSGSPPSTFHSINLVSACLVSLFASSRRLSVHRFSYTAPASVPVLWPLLTLRRCHGPRREKERRGGDKVYHDVLSLC